MNEWLKKLGESAKAAWAKWSKIQKGIIIGIAIAIIVAVAALFRVSSTPTTVRLFNAPVTGDMQSQILTRLDQENVGATVNDAGYISVPDEKTAIKMREILISEGLVPAVVDPWASFFERGWSTTDADQNQKKKLAIERALTQHIQAIEEVASADVRLSLPEDKLFASEQDPVKASVIIRAKPMSDLYTNRRKILGIQRLIMSAVEGLSAEWCTITDSEGNILNDFEGMAESDRLDLVKKQEKLIREGEAHYRAQILKALQNTLSADRVRDLNIKIDMDFSKETKDSTVYHPITIREDNPDTPYDDSEFRDTLPISQQTVTREWQGTGFNPQGPAGTEGQNSPTYADMSNVIGKQTETGVTQNNALNTDQIHREESPRYNKVTVSVNIDGIWKKKYDKNHNPVFNDEGGIVRDYAPVPKEQLEQWADYIQSAIGYDRAKGYKVTVINIPFDRKDEFEAEDEAIRKAQQTRLTIILVLIGLAAILAIFILYRFISREMERRRRLREEELLRKQQAARDAALWEAKEEGVEVTMSVEERKRAELQENAIAMAKEHPEDVAMLIRTWLMEE